MVDNKMTDVYTVIAGVCHIPIRTVYHVTYRYRLGKVDYSSQYVASFIPEIISLA